MLNFVLKNGNDVIINETINYNIANKVITFIIDSEKFFIKANKQDFMFTKINKEGTFKLNYRQDKLISTYHIKNLNKLFYLDTKLITYEYNSHCIYIKYLVKEENDIKTITINLQ